MSLIGIKELSAGYGKKEIIKNVSFEINAGELLGIIGLNGCGKSTLAKAVCNILSHAGEVSIAGENIEKLTTKQIASLISYVPQHSGISIDISVFDVVMMGFNSRLKIFESPSDEMKKKALEVIDALGLSQHKYTNFMVLSEGQKQLVILARALVSEGNFLVMDEPESALDFNVRYKMMNRVRDWIKLGNRAGMVILHDVMLALNSCDRLVLLKDKNIAAVIDVKSDTMEEIEKKLGLVYTNVSLLKVADKSGRDNYLMVCNAEDR